MPEHGGDLTEATRLYGEPAEGWLDLSTGINPHSYAVPAPDPEAWQRLPEEADGLGEATAAFYGTSELLAVPGSQAAIGALPRLRSPCRVAVLWPTYAEHAHRWQRAGHAVERVGADGLEEAARKADVLVIANPNNPDGRRFDPGDLLRWLRNLQSRDGWLVVDEAFADAVPGLSLVAEAGTPGLVVLRSLGKFFGLAGARVGFVAAPEGLRRALAEELGPWAVAGPSRLVARAALADGAWQVRARQALEERSARLDELLRAAGMPPAGGTPLFQWVATGRAAEIHGQLAHAGVWTRLFREPAGLRIGLPGAEEEWERLGRALRTIV